MLRCFTFCKPMAKKINTSKFRAPKPDEQWTSKNLVIRRIGQGYGYVGTFGRATMYIDCPFCDHRQRVYIWSFSGGGKICDGCGVKLGSIGAYCTDLIYNKATHLQDGEQR